jgi:hypothetical protein
MLVLEGKDKGRGKIVSSHGLQKQSKNKISKSSKRVENSDRKNSRAKYYISKDLRTEGYRVKRANLGSNFEILLPQARAQFYYPGMGYDSSSVRWQSGGAYDPPSTEV